MNTLNSEHNFLGIQEDELSDFYTSKVCIQQAPYEYTSTLKKGCIKGPKAIIKASHYVEYYDPQIRAEAYKKTGISTLAPMVIGKNVDAGAMEIIRAESAAILNWDKFLITLGGEHTITYGVYKAFKEKWPKIGMLQLDAHSDLRPEYEGNKWSHASVMSRVRTLGGSLTQVGIRAQSKEEAEIISSNPDIHTWYAHQIWNQDQWMQEAVNSLPERVYISIDADAFDMSLVPGVGTPEPGGIHWFQTLKFLKMVFSQREVMGFDIVEVCPLTEHIHSEYQMAQLIYKLIGYKFC